MSTFAVNTGRNSRGGGLQKFRPTGQPILTFIANGVPITKTAHFLVPIPDSRLRVKIGVLFIPTMGDIPAVPADSGSATLWLYEEDIDEMFSGNDIPTNNIEGSATTPTPIPLVTAGSANKLYGYSREFWSAADYIKGELTSSNNLTGGSWTLQCSCQPDTGQRFTDEEWQQVTSAFSPRVLDFVSF
jgi:hypothetical protein